MATVKAIVKNFFRGLLWLLAKTGLWVPAAFSLLFFLVLLVTRTAFSDVSGLYVLGVVLTAVFALVFTLSNFFRKFGRKNKTVEARPTPREAKSAETTRVQFVEGGAPREEVRFSFPVPEKERDERIQPQPRTETDSRFEPYPGPNETREESERIEPYSRPTPREEYEPYSREENDIEPGESMQPRPTYDQPEPRGSRLYGDSVQRLGDEARETFESPLSRYGDEPEQPKIFRTRMDESLLIYEYSDRLEFYKQTSSGLVRVSVEPKTRRR